MTYCDLIVRDDDLAEAGLELLGFSDDPHAGFGPLALVTTPPMSSASMAGAPAF
jgi:hypothetical protein